MGVMDGGPNVVSPSEEVHLASPSHRRVDAPRGEWTAKSGREPPRESRQRGSDPPGQVGSAEPANKVLIPREGHVGGPELDDRVDTCPSEVAPLRVDPAGATNRSVGDDVTWVRRIHRRGRHPLVVLAGEEEDGPAAQHRCLQAPVHALIVDGGQDRQLGPARVKPTPPVGLLKSRLMLFEQGRKTGRAPRSCPCHERDRFGDVAE